MDCPFKFIKNKLFNYYFFPVADKAFMLYQIYFTNENDSINIKYRFILVLIRFANAKLFRTFMPIGTFANLFRIGIVGVSCLQTRTNY